MRNALATAVVVIGALALAGAVRGQVQPVPGPGSGVVTVTGRVEVADGIIRAVQGSDWKVIVANAPDVRVVNTPTVVAAALPFLKQGEQLAVTWPDGTTETIRIAQLGGEGWVQSTAGGRTRWINLAGARSVENAR